jgi:hypothetical protein
MFGILKLCFLGDEQKRNRNNNVKKCKAKCRYAKKKKNVTVFANRCSALVSIIRRFYCNDLQSLVLCLSGYISYPFHTDYFQVASELKYRANWKYAVLFTQ